MKEFEKALSFAPLVSMEFWQEITEKYSEECTEKEERPYI